MVDEDRVGEVVLGGFLRFQRLELIVGLAVDRAVDQGPEQRLELPLFAGLRPNPTEEEEEELIRRGAHADAAQERRFLHLWGEAVPPQPLHVVDQLGGIPLCNVCPAAAAGLEHTGSGAFARLVAGARTELRSTYFFSALACLVDKSSKAV